MKSKNEVFLCKAVGISSGQGVKNNDCWVFRHWDGSVRYACNVWHPLLRSYDKGHSPPLLDIGIRWLWRWESWQRRRRRSMWTSHIVKMMMIDMEANASSEWKELGGFSALDNLEMVEMESILNQNCLKKNFLLSHFSSDTKFLPFRVLGTSSKSFITSRWLLIR